jgi:hypothetical protein
VPARVLAKCDAEPPELLLLTEPRDELDAPECAADELDPPEELPWEPELAELLALEECSAIEVDDTNRRETMTRAESRIKHLQPGRHDRSTNLSFYLIGRFLALTSYSKSRQQSLLPGKVR